MCLFITKLFLIIVCYKWKFMYIFDLHVCIMQIWAPFTALDNRWHLFRETLSGGSTLSYPKSLRSSSPSMCTGEYLFLTTCSCSFDSLDVNFFYLVINEQDFSLTMPTFQKVNNKALILKWTFWFDTTCKISRLGWKLPYLRRKVYRSMTPLDARFQILSYTVDYF